MVLKFSCSQEIGKRSIRLALLMIVATIAEDAMTHVPISTQNGRSKSR